MAFPSLISLATILVVAAAVLSPLVSAQQCGCTPGFFCSKWGYCGKDGSYCGHGCQSGPCYSSQGKPLGSSVDDIVTINFFNNIVGQAPASCLGKRFYSTQAVLNAPGFGAAGSADDRKREIAAFFGHITHETGYFLFIEENNVDPSKGICDRSKPQYPCNPNKRYYGRGPLQITWNYNYVLAGRSIRFDGLHSPETVANNPIISFKTAFWFWMNNVHSIITSGHGGSVPPSEPSTAGSVAVGTPRMFRRGFASSITSIVNNSASLLAVIFTVSRKPFL